MASEGHLRERTTSVGGLPVRYRVAGEGARVVLVHGLSGSTRWWARNIEALAEHFRVYLVDLPGFGSARHGGLLFALGEAAAWLHAWMEAAAIGPASLIGHSMGGYLCLEVAARWPEDVRRLVLAAPAGVPERARVADYALPLLAELRHLDPRFAPTLAYDALRAGPTTLLRAAVELLARDAREQARAVRAPTLLIWGERDALVSPSAANVLAGLMPDARVLILPRAGHVVMFDAAQAFNEAVIRFLAAPTEGDRLGAEAFDAASVTEAPS
jgi:pimeloyl-ACP methyl ester carboxylesterase